MSKGKKGKAKQAKKFFKQRHKNGGQNGTHNKRHSNKNGVQIKR